ncbi:hypothetical protein RSAG8_11496, partial [Rhizoctonia solani AG-8 WAC10335]
MVQTTAESGPILTPRQLGQRARRTRERELKTQGLYTPEFHILSPVTTPDLPPHAQTPVADPTMQSADESGDEDAEGELESEVNGTATLTLVSTPSQVAFAQHTTSITQVSPHMGHGFGLDMANVPQQLNRAQLAQRERRTRERQQRLSDAATHASGAFPTPPSVVKDQTRSNSSPTHTLLSPVMLPSTDTLAPLNIGAQEIEQLWLKMEEVHHQVNNVSNVVGTGIQDLRQEMKEMRQILLLAFTIPPTPGS